MWPETGFLAEVAYVCLTTARRAQQVYGEPTGMGIATQLFPAAQLAIFPTETRSALYAGSQLGVGLYMFLVGTTLPTDTFKAKARSAAGVSIAGIAAPFLIALLITPYLLRVPGLFAAGISAANATLFMGACIALTAFPMLAQIISEHGLANTALGTVALTAGAFDDDGGTAVRAGLWLRCRIEPPKYPQKQIDVLAFRGGGWDGSGRPETPLSHREKAQKIRLGFPETDWDVWIWLRGQDLNL